MHSFDLPEVQAVFDDIVVEFIKVPNRCQLGTGKLAQWVQIKVIEAFANTIANEHHHSRKNRGSKWSLRFGNELKHG